MRLTKILFSLKKTTGLPGIPVNANPRPQLMSLYSRIIHLSERFPPDAVLAQSANAIAKYRLKIVENEKDIQKIEEKIDCGQIEELIEQAEDEINLLPKMLEWQVYDKNLAEAPVPGQWDNPFAAK
ncbi:ndufa5, NADH-ubiquinone oxidoreductase subunit [Lobulomyces angularis]|nr:ndufa5, NADH-ubiquinone oxidoreductase subunit [Lobulomyces angularis]